MSSKDRGSRGAGPWCSYRGRPRSGRRELGLQGGGAWRSRGVLLTNMGAGAGLWFMGAPIRQKGSQYSSQSQGCLTMNVCYLPGRLNDNGTGEGEGSRSRSPGPLAPPCLAPCHVVSPSSRAAGSGRRRFGLMQASLLHSSRSRAPGPRHLALLAGVGVVAAAAGEAEGGREGARVPGAAS